MRDGMIQHSECDDVLYGYHSNIMKLHWLRVGILCVLRQSWLLQMHLRLANGVKFHRTLVTLPIGRSNSSMYNSKTQNNQWSI